MSEQDYDLSFISYGAGVQSTALLVMSALGLHGVPKAEVAIFADTGDEPKHIYDYLEQVTDWAKPHGIEVLTCSYGVLSEDLINMEKMVVHIPAFIQNAEGKAGMLRRQCTNHYKIVPIQKEVRRYLGYKPKQRMKHRVRQMLGISIDEASRMKPSRVKWLDNCYPLIDAHLHREQCRQIVVNAGLPMPGKSACVYCPYRDDKSWDTMKKNDPESFEQACQFEDSMNEKLTSRKGYFTGEMFLHKSLKPLREVDFDDPQGDLFDEECEGYCGL